MDAEARYQLRCRLNAQRTEDYKNGFYMRAGGVVDPLPDDAPQFVKITMRITKLHVVITNVRSTPMRDGIRPLLFRSSICR